jgi:hypothetical protein
MFNPLTYLSPKQPHHACAANTLLFLKTVLCLCLLLPTLRFVGPLYVHMKKNYIAVNI